MVVLIVCKYKEYVSFFFACTYVYNKRYDAYEIIEIKHTEKGKLVQLVTVNGNYDCKSIAEQLKVETNELIIFPYAIFMATWQFISANEKTKSKLMADFYYEKDKYPYHYIWNPRFISEYTYRFFNIYIAGTENPTVLLSTKPMFGETTLKAIKRTMYQVNMKK